MCPIASRTFMTVQSVHHFVNSIIGWLPSPNHDWALTNGTIGYSVLKPIDGKSNPFIHKIVQVDGVVSHFHHHTNLQK